MDQELFNPQSSSVSSSRIIYTPSTFARTSLLHLQEVGSLQAVHPHVSQREDLVSFLCFIVLFGEGELSYEEQTYQLSEGDCVFIDCRKAYSHSTCRLKEIIAKLNQILTDYYHYYGITDNTESIMTFRYNIMRSLFYCLNRRSQKKSYNLVEFLNMLDNSYPLVRPRIYVNIYE